MSGEPTRSSKRGGLFRRIKNGGRSRNGDDDSHSRATRNTDGDDDGHSSVSSSNGSITGKRRKGLGERLRGIVKGRRGKRRDGGGSGSGNSVDGSVNSLYSAEYDFGPGGDLNPSDADHRNGPTNPSMPHSSLEPHMLAQVIEEDEYEDDDDDEYDYDNDYDDGNDAPRILPNKAKANLMMSKKSRELPHDSMTDAELSHEGDFVSATAAEKRSRLGGTNTINNNNNGISPKNRTATPTSSPSKKKKKQPESLAGAPLALVLLLVDPHSLRFELLQLEFEKPHEATVQDVLEQIQASITEPTLRRLPFVGLVDRTGRGHTGKTPLQVACRARPAREGGVDGNVAQSSASPKPTLVTPHRDVLVGLQAKTSVEGAAKLARPILCDDKVISMLESNGYSMRGWTQDRSREATLTVGPASNNPKRHGRTWWAVLKNITLVVLALTVLLVTVGVTVSGGLPTSVLPSNFLIMSISGNGTGSDYVDYRTMIGKLGRMMKFGNWTTARKIKTTTTTTTVKEALIIGSQELTGGKGVSVASTDATGPDVDSKTDL